MFDFGLREVHLVEVRRGWLRRKTHWFTWQLEFADWTTLFYTNKATFRFT
jgi:hypothetical protein